MTEFRRVALASYLVLAMSAPAVAAPVPMQLSDEDQASWGLIGTLFDQCVASSTLRGDASMCRNIASYLAGFAQKVQAAKAEAAKPAPTGASNGVPPPAGGQ